MKEIRLTGLTEEEINLFFSQLKPKKYFYIDFYEKYIDFVEKNKIFFGNDELENQEERNIFEKAKQLGYIGYDILYSTTNVEEFKNKLTSLTTISDYLFSISYNDEDENALCVTDMWSKWNERPPEGWIAGWCSCGEFYPITLELTEMNIGEYKIDDLYSNLRPILIKLEDITEAKFCSDGFIRISTLNGNFNIKPYKADNNVILKFIDDPLKLL